MANPWDFNQQPRKKPVEVRLKLRKCWREGNRVTRKTNDPDIPDSTGKVEEYWSSEEEVDVQWDDGTRETVSVHDLRSEGAVRHGINLRELAGANDVTDGLKSEWQCGECGTGNYLDRKKCRQCGGVAPGETARPEWTCDCGSSNFMERGKCRSCGNVRPDGLKHPTTGRIMVNRQEWLCSKCQSRNFMERNNCRRCGERKGLNVENINERSSSYRTGKSEVRIQSHLDKFFPRMDGKSGAQEVQDTQREEREARLSDRSRRREPDYLRDPESMIDSIIGALTAGSKKKKKKKKRKRSRSRSRGRRKKRRKGVW